jgi:hypothetical protein
MDLKVIIEMEGVEKWTRRWLVHPVLRLVSYGLSGGYLQ